MPWLESAAFAVLVQAGCAHEPADKLGLASLTCEMAQRGAGKRDSRQFMADLENLEPLLSITKLSIHTVTDQPQFQQVAIAATTVIEKR